MVEAAASVEAMKRDGKAGAGGPRHEDGGGEGETEARVRGRALLTYLDTHETRLFELKKESTGLLQRMAKIVYVDAAAQERERQRLVALHRLMALSWVRDKNAAVLCVNVSLSPPRPDAAAVLGEKKTPLLCVKVSVPPARCDHCRG